MLDVGKGNGARADAWRAAEDTAITSALRLSGAVRALRAAGFTRSEAAVRDRLKQLETRRNQNDE